MGKKILVADASETIISVCRKLLTQHGYEVALYQDGTRALEELKRAEYDLAVIATTTQNVSGQFIIKELRKDHAKARLPVLMLLGSSELLDTQELFDLAPNDTLNKPFSPMELLQRIEQLMQTPDQQAPVEEENVDIESILNDDANSFEKKITDATDKIFLNTLATAPHEDSTAAPPRLDKLDLAEDQYDLEAVKTEEPVETESPHDYDWFIREMGGGGAQTKKPPHPPAKLSGSGKFEVEEMGTSKITLDKLKKMQSTTEADKTKVYLEKLQEPFTDEGAHEASRLSDSRPRNLRQEFLRFFAEALAKELAKSIDFDKLITALSAELDRVGKK